MRLQLHHLRFAAEQGTKSHSSRFRNVLRSLFVSLFVVCAGGWGWPTPVLSSHSNREPQFRETALLDTQPQQVAVPSYFYPGTLPWTQLEASVDQGAHLAIINPNNGPDASANPDYVAQLKSSQAAGLSVLGYVSTDFGRRFAGDVEADIDAYYQWYGIDGIFLDEASNDVEPSIVAYYQILHDYIKSRAGNPLVVINPGTQTDLAYMTTADIIVTFEGTYESYVSSEGLATSAWEWNYPASRFWHLIHATTEAQLLDAVDLSRQRNVGWIYVTPDVMPNPWDTLPPGSYWSDLLNAAMVPQVDQACRGPGFPSVDETEFLLHGTIIDDGVNFRIGPGFDCEVIGTFAEGDTVRILNGSAEVDNRTWLLVANEQGVKGWIDADFVEVDVPPAEVIG